MEIEQRHRPLQIFFFDRSREAFGVRSGIALAFVAFATIHCAAFIAVLRAYPERRPIWFAPLIVFEAEILDVIFALSFREKRSRKHHDERLSF